MTKLRTHVYKRKEEEMQKICIHHQIMHRRSRLRIIKSSKMTANMEPAPTIKDPSINGPIYNQQIVIGYTEDQQGQNIRDEDVVRPDNHK
jgi:hypothetical protein